MSLETGLLLIALGGFLLLVFGPFWVAKHYRAADLTAAQQSADIEDASRRLDAHDEAMAEMSRRSEELLARIEQVKAARERERLCKLLARAQGVPALTVLDGAAVAVAYAPLAGELLVVGAPDAAGNASARLVGGVTTREARRMESDNLDADQLTGWLLSRPAGEVGEAGFATLSDLLAHARTRGFAAFAHSRRDQNPTPLKPDPGETESYHTDEDCSGRHLWLLGPSVDDRNAVRGIWHIDLVRRAVVPPTPRFVLR